VGIVDPVHGQARWTCIEHPVESIPSFDVARGGRAPGERVAVALRNLVMRTYLGEKRESLLTLITCWLK
jgi:hypothetical protein